MWGSLGPYEKIGVLIFLIGSMVDIIQFSWFLKKKYKDFKASLHDRIKKEILLKQIDMWDEGKVRPKDEFPGISLKDKENK